MLFDVSFALRLIPDLAAGAVVTLQTALLGFALAVLVGLVLFLAREMAPSPIARLVGFIVEFVRSTPLLIQLYGMFFVLPDFGIRLGSMAGGILVLGLHYGCYASEIYRSALLSVPAGQWEGAHALGLSRVQAAVLVVFPQMLRTLVIGLGNSLIALFKDTASLSAIGISEILARAKEIGAENFRYTEPITLAGLFFLLLSLLTALGIRFLEARTDHGRSKSIRPRRMTFPVSLMRTRKGAVVPAETLD